MGLGFRVDRKVVRFVSSHGHLAREEAFEESSDPGAGRLLEAGGLGL